MKRDTATGVLLGLLVALEAKKYDTAIYTKGEGVVTDIQFLEGQPVITVGRAIQFLTFEDDVEYFEKAQTEGRTVQYLLRNYAHIRDNISLGVYIPE